MVEFKGLQTASSASAALVGWQVHVTMSCAVGAGKLYREANAVNAASSFAFDTMLYMYSRAR